MNVSGLLKLFDALPGFERLVQQLEQDAPVPPLRLPASVRAPLVARLYLSQQAPLVLVTGRVDGVAGWQQALEAWLPEGRSLLRFPEPTPLPYDRGPWSQRSQNGRLQVLGRLMAGQHPQLPEEPTPPLIVTSARAILQKTLPKRRFLTATRVLRAGQIIDLEKTLASWAIIGYEQVSVVEARGQFSRRGGIIDVYPPLLPFPARIELFGDEIDTIRYFDPATQRTIRAAGPRAGEDGTVGRIVVPPAREALPGVAHEFALSLPEEPPAPDDGMPSWQDDLPDLLAGNVFPNLEYYLPLIYPRPASLLDYLPPHSLILVDDWDGLVTAVRELTHHAEQVAEEQPSLPPNYPSPIFTWPEFETELNWWQPLVLGEGEAIDADARPFPELAEWFDPGPRYGGQMRPLMMRLKGSQQAGLRTIVVSRQAGRLAELWREEMRSAAERSRLRAAGQDVSGQMTLDASESPLLLSGGTPGPLPTPQEALAELPQDGTLTFVQGSLAEGFIMVDRRQHRPLLELLTDAEIFGWSRPAPRRWRRPQPTAPETSFSDITAGDYVVHIEYGIGQFQGLVVRSVGGREREYLLVQYANGDTLYVPVHHADRLGKWIGPEERPPVLHRLGEKSWTAAKARAQKAADELAADLLALYAARETVSGHAFAPGGEWLTELEASFPHRETEDQLRVIDEVKADMQRPRPMDRLVCGDVGYGKTEVALRSAFIAVLDGKQVAVLVPTTILAQQHYHTFRRRLAPFPVKVEMLSRFRTPTRQERILKELRDGRIDIIIGTHRLLSDDVSFKDLGLVIVDEEHRFGVAHKEKLKRWRTEVDFLTMTATPIPRTLYMSLTGVRDISVIDTPPAERLPVQTYVGEADDGRVRRAILRELDRGGQVFFVHNRVQSIHVVYERLKRLVPEACIAIGHGQMSERQLERIMVEFAEGKIDILLSTTIIESGLDFPNANTLIVDRAELFGLAQLYQLRGRVGRGARRAYAYFFHRPWHSLTADAQARLETVAEQTQLGAGYQIAMRDMEIRGAGDLLGAKQSGHIAAVGFDLYTRLLANAVKRNKAAARGESVAPELPEATLIDLPLATYVPPDYVPDASLRLRLYRRMAVLETLEEIDEMAAELADRFGPIPDPVHNLLYQLRIKALAQKAGVTAVTTESGQVKIRLANLEGYDRFHLQRYLGQDVRVSRQAIWMGRNMGTHEWQVALVQVLEKLETFDREKMRAPSAPNGL
ncbi:MAG: transcription-repair coupling factor [Anaerolineae bacterium]